jgi:ribosomal protein S18 acetylase RimI-like enzyme
MAFRNIKFANLLLQKQLFINDYNDILLKRYNNNVKKIALYKKKHFTSEDENYMKSYYKNNFFNPFLYNDDLQKYKTYIDMLNDNIVINYKINVGNNILKDLR